MLRALQSPCGPPSPQVPHVLSGRTAPLRARIQPRSPHLPAQQMHSLSGILPNQKLLVVASVASNSATPWTPPGSSVHGILQERILEWVAVSFSSRFSRFQLCNPMDSTRLLCPWDSPGKNTGVGCCFLFQGLFLTLESNPRLTSPALAGGFSTTEPPGKPARGLGHSKRRREPPLPVSLCPVSNHP